MGFAPTPFSKAGSRGPLASRDTNEVQDQRETREANRGCGPYVERHRPGAPVQCGEKGNRLAYIGSTPAALARAVFNFRAHE